MITADLFVFSGAYFITNEVHRAVSKLTALCTSFVILNVVLATAGTLGLEAAQDGIDGDGKQQDRAFNHLFHLRWLP
jgi:hypothetical protein